MVVNNISICLFMCKIGLMQNTMMVRVLTDASLDTILVSFCIAESPVQLEKEEKRPEKKVEKKESLGQLEEKAEMTSTFNLNEKERLSVRLCVTWFPFSLRSLGHQSIRKRHGTVCKGKNCSL